MKYKIIIVPALQTIRKTTLQRLRKFKASGGRVIFLGNAPLYIDALLNNEAKIFWDSCERVQFNRQEIIQALQPAKLLEIRNDTGAEVTHFLYQMRKEKDERWIFIAHADGDKNKDIPKEEKLYFKLRGEWETDLYNTLDGTIVSLPVQQADDCTTFTYSMYNHDSLLLKLRKKVQMSRNIMFEKEGAGLKKEKIDFLKPVQITLHEPNVLLLDMPEYSLDGDGWKEREEILRLDNNLRRMFGWAERGASMAQPWVEANINTPHSLQLRYYFNSNICVKGAKLAMENADDTHVKLNNSDAGKVEGWYADKGIKTVILPDIIKGKNVLEIAQSYGPSVDLEAVYILGDFGIEVHGVDATITLPATHLNFGDITRQKLPFYGGNITYHLPLEMKKSGDILVETTAYRGHLLSVELNGIEQDSVIFAPYQLVVTDVPKGNHTISLTCYGSRINTFGQLHCYNRAPHYCWGPNAWRTKDASWSYEYQFWPQGILKSPQVYLL